MADTSNASNEKESGTILNMKEAKVSPSFLHANSTSHTGPFSAIAEIIDNAYDPDVQAKELHIVKLELNGQTCLCFTDDGNGMSPEQLHRMLSFGYCDKVEIKGHKPIGFYGNGFKSGSMRLGRDVVVFTKKDDKMSVGFLSQTFLKKINAKTVIVPMLSWYSATRKQVTNAYSSESVQAIVKYSPMKSPHDIMRQFQEIPKKGTRIIIHNLKSVDGRPELDFDSDPQDIGNAESEISKYIEDHVSTYNKSLRHFCSILYNKPKMKIILRGVKVATKIISKSLSKTETDVYKPTFLQKNVPIIFGFSSNLNDYGIMMYHRNRLIKAYERVGIQKQANDHGVGVVGVIEVDFLTPIHNKTDFQKDGRYSSTMNALGQKLNDYWYTKQMDKNSGLNQQIVPDWNWVQCEFCLKWRRLAKNTNMKKINPSKWNCQMNTDVEFNRCSINEEVDDDANIKAATYEKKFKKIERRKKDSMQKIINEKEAEIEMLKNQSLTSNSTKNGHRSDTSMDEAYVDHRRDVEQKASRAVNEILRTTRKRQKSFLAIAAKRSKSEESEHSVASDSEHKSDATEKENEPKLDDGPLVRSERLPESRTSSEDTLRVEDSKAREQMNIYLKELYSLRKNVSKLLVHLLPSQIQIPPKTSQIDEFIRELLNSYIEKNEESNERETTDKTADSQPSQTDELMAAMREDSAARNLPFCQEDRLLADQKYRRELLDLFRQLRINALCNVDYFSAKKNGNHVRFQNSFRVLIDHLDNGIEPGVCNLIAVAHHFDVDPSLPYNGYRSFLRVIQKCCSHILQLTRHIIVSRSSLLFRGSHYSTELESYVNVLGQFRACLHYVLHLPKFCGEGALYPDEDLLTEEEFKDAYFIMTEAESLTQEPFYERPLAFQFCNSVQNALTSICIGLASHGDVLGLENKANPVFKLITYAQGGGKYFLYPAERAKKVVAITRTKGLYYCQSFWDLADLQIAQVPQYFSPSIDVNRIFEIKDEVFYLKEFNSEVTVKINPPCAIIGPAPVNCRLMSSIKRKGQEYVTKETSPKVAENLSDCLIFHIHGGGFVAQKSQSHTSYLRYWAKKTEAPILSVDYSLAPKHHFPRALEECFFAYCWALKHPTYLGWTGEKVVFAGDSAGANLILAVALRAQELNIQKPDGIVPIYGCFLVQYVPSPSRMMSLWDPLLAVGILTKILHAYAGVKDDLYIHEVDSGYVETDIEDGFVNVDAIYYGKPEQATVDEVGKEMDEDVTSKVLFTLDDDKDDIPTHPARRQRSLKNFDLEKNRNRCFTKRSRCISLPCFDNSEIYSGDWCTREQREVETLLEDPRTFAKFGNRVKINLNSSIMRDKILKNVYMSPLYATEKQLKTLGPIYFLVSTLGGATKRLLNLSYLFNLLSRPQPWTPYLMTQ
ncbi:DgyrCDS5858 [Dimorphilus gyrociliatus]|uniref:DgyrCDS5858 n=1 Tax=Dimorphilus gyrociliatus TaxID=2664684 RepID=A0A7I8VL95_9ANNE|nr:DgyrCDS5858 [Dimorphilus gyrociliatus]